MGVEGGVRRAGWHFVSFFIRPIGISDILKKKKKSWNCSKESTFLVFPSLPGIEFIVCKALTSTDRTYSIPE